MTNEKLKAGIAAFKTGNKIAAKRILSEVVRAEPNNETAWLWLAACVENVQEKKYCLSKALAINPSNQNARKALEQLEPLPQPSLEEIGSPTQSKPVSTPGGLATSAKTNTVSVPQASKLSKSVAKKNTLSVEWVFSIIAIGIVCTIIASGALLLLNSQLRNSVFGVVNDTPTNAAQVAQNTLPSASTLASNVQNTPALAATSADNPFQTTVTPLPPTNTRSFTSTPLSTNTPRPTNTPRLTNTPRPINTPIPPTPMLEPVGTLRVDSWLFEITEVRSDPGKDPSRQIVVLLGYLTNEGNQNNTFVAFATLMLRDASGREYEDDRPATWAAENKYGAESGAMLNPGSKRYIAVAFDVLASERTFTIIPGSLVASWSGNIAFTLP